MREIITSRTNPLIVRMKKLKSRRSARREEGVFLCEGPKMLEEAVKWGADIQVVLCAPGRELPPLKAGTRIVEVPEDLLASVADTETPQGVVFLCRGGELTFDPAKEWKRFLVLDGVQDPGNLGTVWRTADAFGADGVVLVNHCADPWNPKTVRATMGAVFRLPLCECSLPELAEYLRARDIPLYATALREDTEDLRAVELTRAAVIIGSEGRGVSDQALDLCQKTVKIPMTERCESLNAAVAASVVLWEMAREAL